MKKRLTLKRHIALQGEPFIIVYSFFQLGNWLT